MEIDRADFRAWLVTKDPKERFTYIDIHDCCLAQYLKDTERSAHPTVLGYTFHLGENYRDVHKIPEDIRIALLAEPQTFGRVLEVLDAQ